jgi:type VI secretion system protein
MRAALTGAVRCAWLAAACLLAGCSMFGGVKAVKPDWKTLHVVTAPDANNNSPLAIDVVLITERVLVDAVSALTAAQYFAARDDMCRSQPGALVVQSLELAPGQSFEIDPKPFRAKKGWAALMFVNYGTPGAHRYRLQLDSSGYLLQLNAQDALLTDTKTGAAH